MDSRIVDTDQWMEMVRGLLREGKEVPVTVTGGSMAPFLVHGRDTVLVKQAQGEFRRGDILFYRRPSGQYVMHRVVKTDKERGLYFAGDAQTVVEGPVPSERVFGRIERVKRKGRWIQKGAPCWDFYAVTWIFLLPVRRKIIRIWSVFHRNVL